ncbi:hypothetical protein BB987_20545 [Photorhabdus temperata]|uniref:Uncharacterized protein n=1 Tax=Photorhabdus khanii NC19 TaxID=1004151 RepID=W3V2I3_9GAMM|nr:hypothetical protein [Photorhabdus khanii]ETS30012.1 hypothetical protein PTE_03342 [Photorhabdus khanii NC19]OHV47622.1 hypothetical protein BB987_20545 [Photorhabdus temperata]
MFLSISKKDDQRTNNEESENIETGSHLEINPETESNGVIIDTIEADTFLYKTTAIEDYLNTAKTLGIAEYQQRHLKPELKEESQWAGQYLALEKSPDEYKDNAPESYNKLRESAGEKPWEKGKVLTVFSYKFKVTKKIKILKPDSHSDAYYADESTAGCKKADAIRRSVQTQSQKNPHLFPEFTNLEEHNFLLQELGKKGYAWKGPLRKKEDKVKEYLYELAISPELLSDNLSLVSQDPIGTYKLNEYGYWEETTLKNKNTAINIS